MKVRLANIDTGGTLVQRGRVVRALTMLTAAALLAAGGCKKLPNPETDEVSRNLRSFDDVHRPNGTDLPLERYFAWSAERDAGARPADDLTLELQLLVDPQRVLVARVKRIKTTSKEALSILEAYLGAHIDGHRALEDVLASRRLGDPQGVARGEGAVRGTFKALRRARSMRQEVASRLGVQIEAPPKLYGGP